MELSSASSSRWPETSSREERAYSEIESEALRCGFPKPLPSEPIQLLAMSGNEERLQAWIQCQKRTVVICKENDLAVKEIGTFMLKGAQDESGFPTILISVQDDTQKQLWEPVLTIIRGMLHDEKCSEIHILLTATKPKKHDMKLYPIEASHPLVQLWPKVLLESVLWIIRWHHLHFEAVEVFRLGITDKHAPPTVIITTGDSNQVGWGEAMEKCHPFFSAKSVSLGTRVVQGRVRRQRNTPTITGRYLERNFIQSVPMGTSIGVSDKGEGSLGGCLQLKNPNDGSVQVVALTNYHVVRGDQSDWPSEMDHLDFKWPEGMGVIQSPSISDHETEIRELKETLKQEQDFLTTSSVKKKLEFNMATEQDKATYDEFIRNIEVLEARLKVCESIDRRGLSFGEVIFSSGFRASGHHALDWAIIRVDPQRIGKNTLPDKSAVTPYPLNKNNLVQSFVDWRASTKRFFKTGRSSGLTMGTYSHIQSHIEIPLPPNSDDWPRKRVTEENVVLSGDPKVHFNEDGDSGSWLISSLGELVGMIWGAGENGQCYFTPIRLVLEDIERVTGLQVELYK